MSLLYSLLGQCWGYNQSFSPTQPLHVEPPHSCKTNIQMNFVCIMKDKEGSRNAQLARQCKPFPTMNGMGGSRGGGGGWWGGEGQTTGMAIQSRSSVGTCRRPQQELRNEASPHQAEQRSWNVTSIANDPQCQAPCNTSMLSVLVS